MASKKPYDILAVVSLSLQLLRYCVWLKWPYTAAHVMSLWRNIKGRYSLVCLDAACVMHWPTSYMKVTPWLACPFHVTLFLGLGPPLNSLIFSSTKWSPTRSLIHAAEINSCWEPRLPGGEYSHPPKKCTRHTFDIVEQRHGISCDTTDRVKPQDLWQGDKYLESQSEVLQTRRKGTPSGVWRVSANVAAVAWGMFAII